MGRSNIELQEIHYKTESQIVHFKNKSLEAHFCIELQEITIGLSHYQVTF